MIVRSAVLLLYAAVLAIAFVVQIVVPALGVYVFYGLLFWLIASFFVFRLPAMSRPIPGTRAPLSAARSAPLASDRSLPPSTPRVALEFCAFCGTTLPSGALRCPACGHSVQPF